MEFFSDKNNIHNKNINEITEEIDTKDSKIEKYNTKKNETIEIKYGNEIYITWKVEFIIPLVKRFLKEKHPKSLISRGINKIDFIIFNTMTDELIPVEIQKTIISSNKNKSFLHTHFENVIRKQLEENIETYRLCWFFFDAEYLRYLQSGNIKGTNASIDMMWIVKLMKEEKLKVFSVRYDGEVKELTTKDFDFLKDVSQTCPLGYENDERVLERNKLKIFYNVIKGYNFTQEEINKFENDFDNRYNKKEKLDSSRFFVKYGNERCKIYGYIIQSTGSLPGINNIMNMNNNDGINKFLSVQLGIFEIIGNHIRGRDGNHMRFIDRFNICQYFPGYIRREKCWLTYKGREMDGDTFSNMCRGMYKNSNTLDDY